MLKINLSDSEEPKKDTGGGETVIQLSDRDTPAPSADAAGGETIIQPSSTGEVAKDTVMPAEPAETNADKKAAGKEKAAKKKAQKPPKEKKAGKPRLMQYLIILLAVSAIALIYVNKDMILSLLPEKEETSPPAPAPPPEPVAAEPAVVTEEPDPVFVAMNRISEVLPDGMWLSSVTINYNGSYNILGIAFAHPAMGSLLTGLGTAGTVSERVIPAKSSSSEAVYNFSVGGTLKGIKVPEFLDIIPTDDLIALVDPVVKRSKELEVKFSRTPRSGQTYGDKDLPFSLEGTYESLKNVIAELCPVDGNIRIYQIEILPATAGKPYNKIKASFSLRTISSI